LCQQTKQTTILKKQVMKKLLVIAALIVSFSNAFAASTSSANVNASSMIDMTPIKKHHTTVANMVEGNTNTIAKPATTVTNVPANNMTTKGFSNNPTAIGTTGSTNLNGVGANISTVADQTHDANAAPNAVIVNYN
jgi:hypothetical protein